MPIAVSALHESGRMSLRVGPFQTIDIIMAGDTGWIALCIMTCCAALDIAFCQRCMCTAAGADTDHGESGFLVAGRQSTAERSTPFHMTITAELFLTVTGLAIR
jgi:hypothetical protein